MGARETAHASPCTGILQHSALCTPMHSGLLSVWAGGGGERISLQISLFPSHYRIASLPPPQKKKKRKLWSLFQVSLLCSGSPGGAVPASPPKGSKGSSSRRLPALRSGNPGEGPSPGPLGPSAEQKGGKPPSRPAARPLHRPEEIQ